MNARSSLLDESHHTETLERRLPEVRSVLIPAGVARLPGDLVVPEGATGLVLFAHGSGSSRRSPRNQFVAQTIQRTDTATLLFDLLARDEEIMDATMGHLRFDIGLLARRLTAVTQWVANQPETRHLGLGYFGASTGAAAALVAAADARTPIDAVVSRGGRPDLAATSLPRLKTATLLIVGGRDGEVVELNQNAFKQLRCEKEFQVVPGATHLFEEPGALEEVAALAAGWFQRHLKPR